MNQTSKHNILVLGSGGREDALAWKIRQSSLADHLYLAPGNGTERAGIEKLDIKLSDFDGIYKAIVQHNVDVLVVGPEQPLVDGLVDFLKGKEDLEHLHIVGPSAKGAMLEGSKDFAKDFMQKYGIPTAKYLTVTAENLDEGEAFLASLAAPYVLKADGLAAGKGVLILSSLEEAQKELREMLAGKFGSAGNKVVIEQFLTGIECSCFVLTDGKGYMLLPYAKDYKRIGDGDSGLNTGGMGAVSPVPFLSSELKNRIEEEVVRPTIEGLSKEGIDYKGFVFIGLMISGGKDPYVIEYNCRMGDPETEVVMPRIGEDILPHLLKLKDQTLSSGSLQEIPEYVTTVVVTSGGYPETYKTGYEITGISSAEEINNSVVFHAGTKLSGERLLSSGGRVLACTGVAPTLQEALDKSYKAVSLISFTDSYNRTDIGKDLEPWI
ncbi:MAG: phosphoribosylamine--glycine ligase [Porphyromonas sp.]|nr:phosphoribosylamine--glycine ligase [Porphyromonas sp.]